MEAAPDDCSVKVAVHIRPLVGDERLHGCRECLSVVPGMPQVQIGTHSFTFDHVYGEGGSPSSNMFEECVAPLVNGLFQGYNGTVLAYGQTGSGKTYTMGTGSKENFHTGVIQQVMNALFNKIEKLKNRTEFQLHVSFIEILKEEVRDLLDSTHIRKSDSLNDHVRKDTLPGKHPVQIRETASGVITLAGLTEVSVSTLKDIVACLEQGSLSRATGSTNMNNHSSRSHAIFTITLEQMHKIQPAYNGEASSSNIGDEYLFAKLHLVDLAGSERAKRTCSDSHRFKEGVHINKGLLALGNVISALGDEKKRKEGLHIPYRDSKLTRLLQDSLGGNSKTFMIACVSPADINADETLNTLKYANRARNIQNKPCINRDLLSDEMQKLHQQLEYLQAELTASRRGASFDELQSLKKRIARLEATNEELSQKLHEYRRRCAVLDPCEAVAQEGHIDFVKREGLKRGSQCMESPDYLVEDTISCESHCGTGKIEREREHALLQNTLDNELNELNKHLEQKESEMKLLEGFDTEELKQHFRKKIMELEREKKVLQQERDSLLAEIESLSASGDPGGNLQILHTRKLKALEAQILDLKKKQESQFHYLKQKERSDEAAKHLQDEIRCIKSQKVQLQQKIKQEAERFRQWKASHEKEVHQLKKEGRRNQFERHKLQAINQRQRMVLQRKTEEAATATKRLKELFEIRKSTARDNSVFCNRDKPTGQSNGKSVQRRIDHELEVLVHVHAVKFEHERQTQIHATLEEELAVLKQADQFSLSGAINSLEKNGYPRESQMSPAARLDRIASLENMVRTSSASLISMASRLSETDECRRALTFAGRWNLICSMADAKNLLQYVFNVALDTRCRLWEKEVEIKELKVKLQEVTTVLQQSESRTEEIVKEQEAVTLTPARPSLVEKGTSTTRQCADGTSCMPSILPPLTRQSKCSAGPAGIANRSTREPAAVSNRIEKTLPTGQLFIRKVAVSRRCGKLWRWKRSHDQWLLQFRWKWQKPWKLSEWIKHTDETIIRPRPCSLTSAQNV